jgi:enoyl-CoA hydratase
MLPRPILIAGGGEVFSAGFDLKEQADIETASEHASRCLTALQAHRSPVIAAVEGAAVGLGMLIATSSDILVVSRTARLRMPEVTIGITSDVAPLRRYLPEPWIRRMCSDAGANTSTQTLTPGGREINVLPPRTSR